MPFYALRSNWIIYLSLVSALVLGCGPSAKKRGNASETMSDSVQQDAPALQTPENEIPKQDNAPLPGRGDQGERSSGTTSDSNPETVVVLPPVAISGAFLTLSCSELPRDANSPSSETVDFGCAVREKSTGKKVYTGSSLTDWSIAMGPFQSANPSFGPIPGIRVSKVSDVWDVEFLLPVAKVTGTRIRISVKNFMDPRDALLETQLKLGAEEFPKVRGYTSSMLMNLGDGVVPEGCEPAKVPVGTPPGYRVFLPIIVTSDSARIRIVLDEVCGGLTTAPSSLALRITRTSDKANIFQQLMQRNVKSMITNEMVLKPGIYNAMFSVEVVERGGFGGGFGPSGPEQRLALGSFLVVTLDGTVAVGDPQFTKK
jgi:hypothetical protein